MPKFLKASVQFDVINMAIVLSYQEIVLPFMKTCPMSIAKIFRLSVY